MSLTTLTAAQLKKARKLIAKKEGFLAKVRKIEQELEDYALWGVLPEKPKAGKKKPLPKRKRAKRPKPKAGKKSELPF